MDALTCEWDQARFLIFSDNVFDNLIYYSHLVPALISFIFGVFILFHNRKSLLNILLFSISFLFLAWSFFDLILWATEKNHYTIFFWSLLILIEPIIYALCLYFINVFVTGRDFNFSSKIIIILIILPTIIFLPTRLSLIGFDLTNCDREAIEGPLVYYGYILQFLFVFWTLYISVKEYINTKLKRTKKEILYVTIGIFLFLLSFSSGNIIGTFFVDWRLGQYGLFGMPIFIGFLAYMIVRFKTFNVKLIGANVLVTALWVLTASLLFIEDVSVLRIIIAITLGLVTIFGYSLVLGVRREVSQREHIEKLAKNLEESNTQLASANAKLKELDRQKTEFVSIASHQLRSPLTSIKGYSSMLLEGSFGALTDKAAEAVGRIFQSSQKLVMVIEDFLNITRIELGKMKYEFATIDLKETLQQVVNEMRPSVEHSGLAFNLTIQDGIDYRTYADSGKISQVISNLIDNALKYTRQGSIKVSLSAGDGKIRLAVADTGIGINKDTLPKLFEKFTRANVAGQVNIKGTGLGLYVAKQIVEAHGGQLWAESLGEGYGSSFIVELKGISK